MNIPHKNLIFLRVSSNKEKKYCLKAGSFFSGILAKGNFMESSPGLLSSLFIKMASLPQSVGYAIDPVTYVFCMDSSLDGSIKSWQKVNKDKAEARLVSDLEIDAGDIEKAWLRTLKGPKSKRDADKIEIYTLRRAYKKLAEKTLGQLKKRIGTRALEPSDFKNNKERMELISNTVQYQENALKERFSKKKFSEFNNKLPSPQFIFSPYFPIHHDDGWFNVMKSIWSDFLNFYKGDNGVCVLQCSIEMLDSHGDELKKFFDEIKPKHVALWLDNFGEDKASVDDLVVFGNFVMDLNKLYISVFNLYGGSFSMFLYPFGMSGLVCSSGYGEAKGVDPISGGLPAAKFYIKSRHTRESVATAYDLLVRADMGETLENYYKDVCACPICKRGIEQGRIDIIRFYGELGEEVMCKDGVARRFPTSNAMDRCAFHFLFNKLMEYRAIKKLTGSEILEIFKKDIETWNDVDNGHGHLQNWYSALTTLSQKRSLD